MKLLLEIALYAMLCAVAAGLFARAWRTRHLPDFPTGDEDQQP